MKFTYQGRTKEGRVETGTIDAYSKEAAALLLQKYNIFVTSLREQKKGETFLTAKRLFRRRISKKDLAIFFRQLSVMLESRVPVVQSLFSLAEQTTHPRFRESIFKIAGSVEEGVPLSDALGFYPKIFGNFYVNVIKAGEASGRIAQALYYVSEHLEREHDIMAQVKQAMIYPVFLLVVLFFVVGIVIVQVVPKITDLLKESNSVPSFSTMIILNFYNFLGKYWQTLIIGILAIVAVITYYLKTKSGKKNYDRLSLKVPFFGDLLKKVFLVRFCSNISTLLIAGITINKALTITEDTVNNDVYKTIIAKVGQEVSAGEKMSSIMIRNQDYFPPFVVQMVKVGEETGKLDNVLTQVVNFYEKEIRRVIDLFSRLLEPIMIIILGIVVTILAFSVFSSIYGVVGTI